MNENYVPYGEEWKKEMMKIPKASLIDLLKHALVEKKQSSNVVVKSIDFNVPDCYQCDPVKASQTYASTISGNYKCKCGNEYSIPTPVH